MAKNEYKCILYDKGDKLISKFGNLFDTKDILEVEETELKYVGIYPTLFIKFIGKAKDISDLSNYYLPGPGTETEIKYKEGLKYFNETKTTKIVKNASGKHTAKVLSTFGRRGKQDNTLTEEDLKPRVMPVGTFVIKPPLKKESNESNDRMSN